MIESLVGSKNVERILIFLLVNERCYGAQLQRLLKTPLTPIQKALMRMQKAGIVISYYEGKTRMFQLNPVYPLLSELERLLRKAYSLLPLQEKKQYCFIKAKYEREEGRNDFQILTQFWKQLCAIRYLSFQAKSKANTETGWNGAGKGEVLIKNESDKILIFNEKGSWIKEDGQEIDFTNTFRWILDLQSKMVSLEHLRFGANHPVFLFHLVPSGKNTLDSLDSHFCADDTYFGKVIFDPHSLNLQWRIIGPKKDEEISYLYT